MQREGVRTAYFIGKNRYSYRPDEPAEIIGVVFYTPDKEEARVCYHVRYVDGMEDYNALADNENFEIVSASCMRLVKEVE